mmetsp:Transcript_868/g.2015  ORF Transcript_868/g.2015 Transcript_868/m.2015 type:complete len:237 (+) Transcript_868:68-778(+)
MADQIVPLLVVLLGRRGRHGLGCAGGALGGGAKRRGLLHELGRALGEGRHGLCLPGSGIFLFSGCTWVVGFISPVERLWRGRERALGLCNDDALQGFQLLPAPLLLQCLRRQGPRVHSDQVLCTDFPRQDSSSESAVLGLNHVVTEHPGVLPVVAAGACVEGVERRLDLRGHGRMRPSTVFQTLSDQLQHLHPQGFVGGSILHRWLGLLAPPPGQGLRRGAQLSRQSRPLLAAPTV